MFVLGEKVVYAGHGVAKISELLKKKLLVRQQIFSN